MTAARAGRAQDEGLANVAESQGCALCGLDVGRAPVLRLIGCEQHAFCCTGCAATFEFAHRNGQLEWVLARLQATPEGQRGLFARGEKVYFALEGMSCAACAPVVERILSAQAGVTAAEVSYAVERGYLRYDPSQTTPEAALRSLERLGYRPRLVADAVEERLDRKQDRILSRFLISLGFGMNVMLIYLNQLYHLYARGLSGTPVVRGWQYLAWILTTPVLLLAGYTFPLGAYRALRARTATMDTLVTLGVLSAYAYSVYVTLTGRGHAYFDSVVMVITFVTLGRHLEALGSSQARKDIRRLLALQPARARRRAESGWQDVPAADLVAGDDILVRPGERVPADGEILQGEAAVDEAVLTGESAPVEKVPGDTVYAGAVVTDAPLTCRVTAPPEDTRLAQITALVEQTLAAKPPVQRLADRAGAYLALAVLLVAALTAVSWLSKGHDPAQALLPAVAVLVVACPCAVGLATPLALAIALGHAGRAGILVRNPAALEVAPRIQRMVFDKTGTLTRGQMAVVGVEVAPGLGIGEPGLIRLAAAVEQYSEHPLARAIMEAVPEPPAAAEGFQAVRGMGASARVCFPPGPASGAPASSGRKQVLVGSQRFLEMGAGSALDAAAQGRAELGETIVWVGVEGEVAGFIALRDEPNRTAARALRRLQGTGVRTVMLSGDSPRTVRAIAGELGLSEYEGNCSPEEKAARIAAWQKAGVRVGMVGDGVNDAPALAQADLSLTVAGGTDIAGEASDIVLLGSDLTLVPELIGLGRRTSRVIYMNLGWALAYNLATMPLAALGVISPAIAATTMTASSLLVVGNSLRLRR